MCLKSKLAWTFGSDFIHFYDMSKTKGLKYEHTQKNRISDKVGLRCLDLRYPDFRCVQWNAKIRTSEIRVSAESQRNTGSVIRCTDFGYLGCSNDFERLVFGRFG